MSKQDVLVKSNKMKANMGGYEATCPGKLIKKYIFLLADDITYIFNQCLTEGVCPKELKQAIITPIYKGGSRKEPTNYRPVSCVPFLAKLLEALINDQIKHYLQANNFINPMQFGFREGSNTTLALAHLQMYVTKTWEENKIAAAIFVDVEKAFDSINRSFLLHILKELKFTEEPLAFFKSYFTDRTQRTKNGKHLSDCSEPKLGTPQGTSLSPTLFLIFINSLLRASTLQPICFADDITFIAPVDPKNPTPDITHINRELAKITQWYCSHRLCINISKTKMMIFSTRQRLSDVPLPILMNDTNVQQVDRYKCLGITLDKQLSFREHVEIILSKVKMIIPALAKLENCGVPRNHTLGVYRALFLPYIIYGIEIYGKTYTSILGKLQIAQNNAVRAMLGYRKRENVTGLYGKHKLLNIKYLYRYELGVMGYKNFTGRLQGENSFYYEQNKNNLINSLPFKEPFTRFDYRLRAPDLAIVKLWNTIDKEIRDAPTIKMFKRKWHAKLLTEQSTEW